MLFKREILRERILAILLVGLCISSVYAKYSGGTGEPNSPYQIGAVSDWNDLIHTSADWNKHFIMIADINLQGVILTPVGDFTTGFFGIFDGNSHIIRNVVINQPNSIGIGLFGYIDGQIRNLGVEDVNITGQGYFGGLVGYNGSGSSISNCYSTGLVSGPSESYTAGGLVGLSWGSISNCYSTSSVSGLWDVGGLVGGNVGNMSNCYSTGDVDGNDIVGGLAGDNGGSISNCYSTGDVDGNDYVGGLVGYNASDGSISASFWDVNTSGWSTSDGGEGENTANMQKLLTFTSAGWDFTTPVWKICEGTNYPKLAWQQVLAGDFVCPDGVDFSDFAVLANQWMLAPGVPSADIAPAPAGDGIVNLEDLAVFFENWLQGTENRPQRPDEPGDGEGYVQQIDVQPCDTNLNLRMLEADGNDTRFTITVQDSNLYFEDLITANCCILGIGLDVSVAGNEIQIHEREIITDYCTCHCDFPTTALLGPFADGNYTVEVFDAFYGNSLGIVEVTIPSQ